MKILFCGDVVGRSGRAVIKKHLNALRKKHALDAVIVNGENAASGFGLTHKICEGFREAGADVITGGDHCFDQKEVMHFINQYPQLLRPGNLPDSLPGAGVGEYEVKGKKLVVAHVLCQLFMKYTVDHPFLCLDKLLQPYELGRNADAIIVDVHGEATSEKMAIGHYLDGRVSLVTGSHTHVPTADEQILPGGTAYQTDAGMCGDYDSVIGFKKEVSLPGFLHKIRTQKNEVASGDATLCGIIVETEKTTGLAEAVYPVRVGGRLSKTP